jgi:hypothetical protein
MYTFLCCKEFKNKDDVLKKSTVWNGGCRESNAGPLPGSSFDADYSVWGQSFTLYPEGRIIPLDHTPAYVLGRYERLMHYTSFWVLHFTTAPVRVSRQMLWVLERDIRPSAAAASRVALSADARGGARVL